MKIKYLIPQKAHPGAKHVY